MKRLLLYLCSFSMVVMAISGCIGGSDESASPAALDPPMDLTFSFPPPSLRTMHIGDELFYNDHVIKCIDISVHSTSALLEIDGQVMITSGSQSIKIPFENVIIRLDAISVTDLSVSLLIYELW